MAISEQNNAKTVLFVVTDPLLPSVTGGTVRLWLMIEHLQQSGFKVGVVTINHLQGRNDEIRRRVDNSWFLGESGGISAAGKWPARIRDMLVRLMTAAGKQSAPPGSYRKRPSSFILRKINEDLCELAARVAARIEPVAVVAQYAWSARALSGIDDHVLKLVDTIDIQHRRRSHAQAAGSDLPHHVCSMEEEVGELSHADVLIAIQKNEKITLKEMCPDQHVIVAEHALPVEAECPHSPHSSYTVLFIGAKYDPNNRGLEEFLEDSWPKIHEAYPGSRFVVCGSVCIPFKDKHIEGVSFKGIVRDLAPYYEQAAIVINPVPYGSGLKIKTVEALCRAKCLISTPSGVEGLEDAADPPFFVVPSAGQMSDIIISLLGDPPLRREIEEKTWNYSKQRLAPGPVYADLVQALRKPKDYILIRPAK